MSKEGLGEFLKKKREEAGISLRDFSHKTKITSRQLKSLEENNLSELPDKTYIKGFLKAYAREFKLDIHELFSLLDNLYSSGEEREEGEKREEEDAEREEEDEIDVQPVGKSIVILKRAAIASFIIGAIATFVMLFNNFVETIKQESLEVSQRSSNEAQKREEERVAIEESAQAVALVAEEEKEMIPVAATAIPEVIPEVIPTVETEKEEEKKVVLRKGRRPTSKMIKEDAEGFSPIPDELKSSFNSENFHNLLVMAQDENCWITYKKDDQPIKVFTLEKGKHVLIQAEESIRLVLGNANVTRIYYNEEMVDPKSSSGVKSFYFVKDEKIKDVLYPLFVHEEGNAYTSENYAEKFKEKVIIE